MRRAEVMAAIVGAQQDQPCRDCGAEGFRLTGGRCDGCHAEYVRTRDACPECLRGPVVADGLMEPDTGHRPVRCRSCGATW